MKYGDYKNKQELAIYIVTELEKTISYLGDSEGVKSKLDMFNIPRANKKDLVAKKQELVNKYKLIKKEKLWTY